MNPGIVVTSQFALERDLKMGPGDRHTLADYEFHFLEYVQTTGPNYVADEVRIEVSRGGKLIALLAPQKRRYLASGQVMTEADIDPGFLRDVYVAMGEPIGEGGAIAVARHAALNWVSVGSGLRSLSGNVAKAEVVVADWPPAQVASFFDVSQAVGDSLFGLFEPIAAHLGLHYQWDREGDAIRMTFWR